MISLLKQYKRLLAWLISGLVIAFLLSLATSNHQTATAFQSTATAVSTRSSVSPAYPDFAATHLEPNFYEEGEGGKGKGERGRVKGEGGKGKGKR